MLRIRGVAFGEVLHIVSFGRVACKGDPTLMGTGSQTCSSTVTTAPLSRGQRAEGRESAVAGPEKDLWSGDTVCGGFSEQIRFAVVIEVGDQDDGCLE